MAAPPHISSLVAEQIAAGEGTDPSKLAYALNQFLGPTHSALSRGLTFSDNFRATIKSVRLEMPAAPPWVFVGATGAPAFQNSWTNESAPTAYVMAPDGRVDVVGIIKSGTTWAVFTLPAGFRPASTVVTATWSSSGAARLGVATDGGVAALGGTAWHGLHVSFRAASPAPPSAFSGGDWPVKVAHGLPKCIGVLPIAATLRDAVSADSVGQYTLDWADTGDGKIKIRSAWGFQWGRTYDVLLLMLAG
jgi:hypothetical protein